MLQQHRNSLKNWKDKEVQKYFIEFGIPISCFAKVYSRKKYLPNNFLFLEKSYAKFSFNHQNIDWCSNFSQDVVFTTWIQHISKDTNVSKQDEKYNVHFNRYKIFANR